MRLKKWGMAGAAAVTTGALAVGLLGTAGIASAQTPPGGGYGNGPRVFRGHGLERLAQQLGVTVEQLRQATPQARSQMVDEAIANGKITDEQGKRLKEAFARAGQRGQNEGKNSGPRGGQPNMTDLSKLGFSDPIDTLAGSMGLTKQDLSSQLRGGKSLADIGAEHGRTPEMLKQTVLTQLRADLKAMVDGGKMNQRVADTILRGADRALLPAINAKKGQFNIQELLSQFGPMMQRGGQQGTPQGGPFGGPQQGGQRGMPQARPQGAPQGGPGPQYGR